MGNLSAKTGFTPAQTRIPLTNNSSSTVQNFSAYDAQELTGFVYVDGTTDYRASVKVQIVKNGAGTYEVAAADIAGDDILGSPIVSFSMSGASLIATLPNFAGFVSAYIQYNLNAPALGGQFPLSVDVSNITNILPGNPPGVITAFAGSSAPSGWLECDGSTYLATQYPQLYATLLDTWEQCYNPLTGVQYGSVSVGYFRVPDLRGVFLRGEGTFSDGIGTNTSLAGYQADQMQGHYHAGGAASTTSNQVGSSVGYIQRDNSGVGNPSSLVAAPITDGTNGTPRTGKETRPRNVGVKYIIKT